MSIVSDFDILVRECVDKAVEIFNLPEIRNVEISYDLKGQTAGYAIRRNNSFYLKFNKSALEIDFKDMSENTIPHEVAHIVCMANPKLGNGHNRGWKNVCVRLGGVPSRTHSMDLPRARRVKRFVYILDDKTEIEITSGQHKKVQAGRSLYMKAAHTKSKTAQNLKTENFIKEITVK